MPLTICGWRRFEVTGNVQPPPEEFVTTVADVKTDKVEKVGDVYFYATKLRITDDYQAISGYITVLTSNVFSEDGVRDELKNKTEGYSFSIFMIREQYLIYTGIPPGYSNVAWENFTMKNQRGELPVLVRDYFTGL